MSKQAAQTVLCSTLNALQPPQKEHTGTAARVGEGGGVTVFGKGEHPALVYQSYSAPFLGVFGCF